MYALPEDFDTSFLLGQELLSITIGKNHVELMFEPVRITIESGLSCLLLGIENHPTQNLHDSACHAVALLGKNISAVEKLSSTDIVLWFSQVGQIRLAGANCSYECYQISTGQGQLYVV